ncbi:MAG: hypothetical protein NTZ97_05020 [Candidatus Moranbacteria bacterium]|nr:hypothetical protein [Candidatus Moranbacteria bacterium]
MIGSIIFILLGLFILYLVIDFAVVLKGDIHKFMDKWSERLLWTYLPFYACWRLTRVVILKKEHKIR